MHEAQVLLTMTIQLTGLVAAAISALTAVFIAARKLLDNGSKFARRFRLDEAWSLWMQWRNRVRDEWKRHTPAWLFRLGGGLSRAVLALCAVSTYLAGLLILAATVLYTSPLGFVVGGSYSAMCFLFAYGVVISEMARRSRRPAKAP